MNEEKELWDALVLKLAGSPMVTDERPETTATRIIERRRLFFDQGIGVLTPSITDPTKPTKPARPTGNCKACLGSGADDCSECNGCGKLECAYCGGTGEYSAVEGND